MRQFAIGIIVLQASLNINGLYTIVECPVELRKDIAKYSDPKPQVSCTMQLLCPPEDLTDYENRDQGYQVHEYDPDAKTMCEVKLKVNIVKNLSATDNKTEEENPCIGLVHHEHPVLLPHLTNCSLFYKCDWGVPILFECPEELHFNPVLQVCDWPWQAVCDLPRIDCPRPFPRCPIHYSGPLLLPHSFLCDRFYQCNRGTLQLQICPTGLYFNSHLKVCDWPYNSNCRNC